MKEFNPNESKDFLLSKYDNSFIEMVYRIYSINDAAHDVNHLNWVISNARSMIDHLPECKEFENEILIACLLHDVGCHINREFHHDISAEWFISNRDYLDLPDVNDELVIYAIRNHRASFKGKRLHFVEDVVAAADKGKPSVNGYAYRSVQYHIEMLPVPSKLIMELAVEYDLMSDKSNPLVDEIVKPVVNHLVDKFGEAGYFYNTLPDFYKELYAEELSEMKKACYHGNLAIEQTVEEYVYRLLVDPIRKANNNSVA